jgi:hypothetical protein
VRQCQIGTWLRFGVFDLVASECIGLQGLGSFCAGGFAWQVVAGRRAGATSRSTLPSPQPSPTAVKHVREGAQLAAAGEGVRRWARMVPLSIGGAVRACDYFSYESSFRGGFRGILGGGGGCARRVTGAHRRAGRCWWGRGLGVEQMVGTRGAVGGVV